MGFPRFYGWLMDSTRSLLFILAFHQKAVGLWPIKQWTTYRQVTPEQGLDTESDRVTCAELVGERPLLRMGSGSGELDGGATGDWGLLFFSPWAVAVTEVVAWESGFSARIVSFTFVFAVFRRLINWQGVGVEEK